jgi:hypothetical protein
MKPMTPMKPLEAWWPAELGNPSSAGSQNQMRYAFFRQKQRLVVEREGAQILYDTAHHDINGFAQADRDTQSVEFTSQRGVVRLEDLVRIR